MTITLIRAVIIYLFVVIAVRVMGKRQLGELKPHEFVITILISSVATVPIEDNSIPLANSLLPILIFICLEIAESALAMKSVKFRNALQGKPIFIIKNGVLQQKAMKKLRYTVNDVIDTLRQKDVFDISEVENAVVETNGSLSVQQKSENEKPSAPVTVIADGKIIEEYFGSEKKDKKEIEIIASATGIETEKIMLLTVDENGKVYLIRKDG